MKILLVEDDAQTAAMLVKELTAHHHKVDRVRDGQTGWELAQSYSYDLILLDVVVPELDGIQLCRRLRDTGNQSPILLLTAKDSVSDRLLGLEAGADDYVVKPFDLSELLARIRALLRRGSAILPPVLIWEKLQLNPDSREVFYAEKLLRLTPKEYELLELFLRHPQRIFSRAALLERIWALDEFPGEAAVTTQIKGLRHKLKAAGLIPDPIETAYGLGYRLKPLPEAASQSVAEKAAAATNRANQSLIVQSVEQFTGQSVEQFTGQFTEQPITQVVPPQTDINLAQTRMRATIAVMWESFKDGFAERITLFDRAIAQFSTGTLDKTLHQEAKSEAHRLIGSLGSFGLPAGSQIARQLEQLLQTKILPGQAKPGQAEVQQLSQLIQSLKQLITTSPTFDAEASNKNASYHDRPSPPRLLIIDDDVRLTEQLQHEAIAWGFQVEVATTLTIARVKIATQPPEVILLELNFPDTAETGLTLLSELTAQRPTIPVLVLTAQNRLSDRVAVARLGGQRFLRKSAASEQIFKTVAQVLRQTQRINAKVMVVDDDPQLLSQLRSLLQPWGFNVTTVEDPDRFWDVLESVVPDLLILDIEMREFSGIELCQVVRTDPQWSHIPILFLSAHTDAATRHRVFAVGADDYITKPIQESELTARIFNRLERTQLLRKVPTVLDRSNQHLQANLPPE